MKIVHIFKSITVAVLALFAASSCNKVEMITLTVDPATPLTFLAEDKDGAVLTVTTNAPDWSYTAPDWLDVLKQGNRLNVFPQKNTIEEERLGRIIITAEGVQPVKVMITQEAGKYVETPEGNGPVAELQVSASEVKFDKNGRTSFTLKMVTAEAASEEMKANLMLDPDYLPEYEVITGAYCKPFEDGDITISDTELVIAKGEKESDEITVALKNGSTKEFLTGYLVPIIAKSVSNVSFTKTSKRANVLAYRQNFKTIKNVAFLEVNDTNPLNLLEVNLEDGTPFFDAMVIFAANININKADGLVYLHTNPNVKALLNENETYLQPLRRKGIKVYLGILGNHDESGVCQLSEEGAKMFAHAVATTVRDCHLDGVTFDDEYSGTTDMSNPLLGQHSQSSGDRLAYEIHKAMKKECPWETGVSYYAIGSMKRCGNVKDLETGQVYTPGQYIDWYCADYGGYASPYDDLGYDKCSAKSHELGLKKGFGTSSDDAQKWVKEGYGWIMYFAYQAVSVEHKQGLSSNLRESLEIFNQVAAGAYGQSVLQPTHYYKMINEGVYDPTRYEF